MNNNDVIFPIINNKSLQREDFVEWANEIFYTRIKIPFIIVISFSILFYAIVLVSLVLGMRIVSFFLYCRSVCLFDYCLVLSISYTESIRAMAL